MRMPRSNICNPLVRQCPASALSVLATETSIKLKFVDRSTLNRMKKVVILLSGRGSNLQALLDAKLPCQFAAVISNRADAQGLAIAKSYGMPTAVVPHNDYADREAFDKALAKVIDLYTPDVIALTGSMRILTTAF